MFDRIYPYIHTYLQCYNIQPTPSGAESYRYTHTKIQIQ